MSGQIIVQCSANLYHFLMPLLSFQTLSIKEILIQICRALNNKNVIPVVSAHWITGMEVEEFQGRHDQTIIYTARQGLFHRVRETPEQIEALLNSPDVDTDPSANRLLHFAYWLRDNQVKHLGQSYASLVNNYVQELRTPK